MERWVDEKSALLHIQCRPAHAETSSSGRISAVHREARKWQVANRQTSSAGPDWAKIDIIAIGIGLNGCDRDGFGVFARNAMLPRFRHGSREAARLPTPVDVNLCLSVPDFWVNCHPPRTQLTGVSISLVPRHALHCFSLSQTPPAPLDKSTASAVPDAAHL
jgi:hypothetical protein